MTELEKLEKAVLMLEEQVATNKSMSESYQKELELAKKQLTDFDKPEITSQQVDAIHNAIENAVNDFNFEDTDNYNIEYELDYDGRVNASSLEFQSSYELVELIVDKVSNLFKEADCPEDKEAEELSDELNKKHGYETN